MIHGFRDWQPMGRTKGFRGSISSKQLVKPKSVTSDMLGNGAIDCISFNEKSKAVDSFIAVCLSIGFFSGLLNIRRVNKILSGYE